jgi:nuclear pore complex protein Nup188
MVSLAILSVGSALDFLEDPQSSAAPISSDPSTKSQFLLNTHTLSQIHEILMNAADAGYNNAGPVILAWSSILKALNIRVTANRDAHADELELERFNRRSSNDTDVTLAQDPYDDMIQTIMQSLDDQNPIDFLALTAINRCNTLETLSVLAARLGNTSEAYFCTRTGAMMRIVILDLIKSLSTIGLKYGAEVVEPLISLLFGGQNYWDFADAKQLGKAFDPISTFLRDDELVAAFLDQAMSRYPYESLPFLRIIHAISACSLCLSEQNSKSAITILE